MESQSVPGKHADVYLNYILVATQFIPSFAMQTLTNYYGNKWKRQVEGGKSKELLCRPWRPFENMFSQGLFSGQ
jgi:hypothetical protein